MRVEFNRRITVLREACRRLDDSIAIAGATRQYANPKEAEAEIKHEDYNRARAVPRISSGTGVSADGIKAFADKATNKHDEIKAAVNVCTARQVRRIGKQGLTTMKAFEAVALRDREQVRTARSALEAAAMVDIVDVCYQQFNNDALFGGLEDMKSLRTPCSRPAIAFDIARHHGEVTPETVLLCFHQFGTHGYFKLGERDAGQREWVLSEDNQPHVSRLQGRRIHQHHVHMMPTCPWHLQASFSGTCALLDEEAGLTVRSRYPDILHQRCQQTGRGRGPSETAGAFLRKPGWIQTRIADSAKDQLADIKHEGLPGEVHEFDRGGVPFIEIDIDRVGTKGEALNAQKNKRRRAPLTLSDGHR